MIHPLFNSIQLLLMFFCSILYLLEKKRKLFNYWHCFISQLFFKFCQLLFRFLSYDDCSVLLFKFITVSVFSRTVHSHHITLTSHSFGLHYERRSAVSLCSYHSVFHCPFLLFSWFQHHLLRFVTDIIIISLNIYVHHHHPIDLFVVVG